MQRRPPATLEPLAQCTGSWNHEQARGTGNLDGAMGRMICVHARITVRHEPSQHERHLCRDAVAVNDADIDRRDLRCRLHSKRADIAHRRRDMQGDDRAVSLLRKTLIDLPELLNPG